MRISHKYKFIFYAINKTGSSSIRQYFHHNNDIDSDDNTPGVYTGTDKHSDWSFHHTTYRRVKKHFATTEYDYNDYLKFAFTRNPWDREVSMYHYKLKRRDQNNCPWAKKELGDVNSFEEWIKSDQYMKFINNKPQYLQRYWIDFNDPKFFVFSYENLQKDFNAMCQMIGAKPERLGCKERGNYNHIPYTEYYDDEMMEIVSEKSAEDIKTFNYKFGE